MRLANLFASGQVFFLEDVPFLPHLANDESTKFKLFTHWNNRYGTVP